MSKIKRSKIKAGVRLQGDKEKWGKGDNTYSSPPEYYYDLDYQCTDCGKNQIWTALEHKDWYEELGKTINSNAIRCRICRAHIQAIKEDQKRHMEEMKNKPKHLNEWFFKNT